MHSRLVPAYMTVFLDHVAFGLAAPTIPIALTEISGDASSSAVLIGISVSAFALAQLVSSPLAGWCSDRLGRRRLLVAGSVLLGSGFLVMAAAQTASSLIIGRLICGIGAANAGVASAYVADWTAPEERARAYGWLGTAFGSAYVVAPIAGGLLGDISWRLPFVVGALVALLNAGACRLLLKTPTPSLTASPASVVESRGGFRLQWRRLMLIAFLSSLANTVYPTALALLVMRRYQWNIGDVGTLLGAVGICTLIVHVAVYQWAARRLRPRIMLIIGLTCGIVGFLVYALAPTSGWFYVGVPIMAFGAFGPPSVQSMLAEAASAREAGRTQGIYMATAAVANLAGPVTFSLLLAAQLQDGTPLGPIAFPFLASALILVVALIFSLTGLNDWSHCCNRRRHPRC